MDWLIDCLFYIHSENLKSNTELSVQGAELLEKVVVGWLRGALPALPEEGVQVHKEIIV